MINKVVYSFWSKPTKNKYIGFNSKKTFENCARLSVLTSRKWAECVELVTDKKGYKLLIEDLKLPFNSVRVELDVLNNIDDKHWALGKIYACAIQNTPFMHIDFDAIWFNKPPDYLLNAPTAFQSKVYIDNPENSIYINLVKQVGDCSELKINKHIKIQQLGEYAVNCGFMCFNDRSIIPIWQECALDYIKKIKPNQNGYFDSCIIFEQFFLSKLLQANKITIKTLKQKGIFVSVGSNLNYVHLMGYNKRIPLEEEKIANKLKQFKK